MKRLTRRDWWNLGILALCLTAFLLGYTRLQYHFGSSTDWNNQHWVLPHYFRLLFLNTGQLFPNLAFHLGGGQNIYYLAYYGLFSPIVLLSYLVPFVPMMDYIIFVSVLSIYADVGLFYVWLRKRVAETPAFLSAFLFLFSMPLIYHSHRHIMFVSYLPFLLLALFATDAWMHKKSRAGLILACFLVVMTSFFFAVGAFLAVFLYAGFVRLEQKTRGWCKSMAGVTGGLCIAGLLSGVLILPTLYTLLSGRNASNSKNGLLELIPRLNVSNLLYIPHSAGLTAISLAALLLTLFFGKKHERFLAGGLCALAFIPAAIYLMNGTMYFDAKVLIPLSPLVLLLTALRVTDVLAKKLPLKRCAVLLAAAAVLGCVSVLTGHSLFYLSSHLPLLICGLFLADLLLLCGSVALYQKYGRPLLVLFPAMALALAICIFFNWRDILVPRKKAVLSESEIVTALAGTALREDSSFYRIGNYIDSHNNVNMVYDPEYYQATIYSSTHNQWFSHFYFDGVYSEAAYRNAALTTQSRNYLFNIFMGNRYIIDEITQAAPGETLIGSAGGIGLYRNDAALPMGYVSQETMSRAEFEQLSYPYTVEALLNYAIVEDAPPSDLVSGIVPLTLATDTSAPVPLADAQNGGKLSVNLTRECKCTARLSEPVENQLILLRCRADNRGAGQDIFLDVNGIRNKLTQENWRYPNNNFTFDYVFAAKEPLRELSLLFSAGCYRISDLELYALPLDSVYHRVQTVEPYQIDRAATAGDVISGTVSTKQGGCLVLSVPFDKGFSAMVDGQPVPCQRVDQDFIGFSISPGKHRVVFTYRAPLRTAGDLCSLAGGLLFAGLLLVKWLKKRSAVRQEEPPEA